MFRNTMPRYEILSPDAIGVLDRGWRRIVSEIGVQFAKPEALELFRRAGQKVEDEVVFLDPDFVWNRWPRRRGSSTSRPATRPTACTSAATRWCSAASTAARSSARATSAGTRPWTTSAG